MQFENLPLVTKILANNGHTHIISYDSEENPLVQSTIASLLPTMLEMETFYNKCSVKYIPPQVSDGTTNNNTKPLVKLLKDLNFLLKKTGRSLEHCKDALLAAGGNVQKALSILEKDTDF